MPGRGRDGPAGREEEEGFHLPSPARPSRCEVEQEAAAVAPEGTRARLGAGPMRGDGGGPGAGRAPGRAPGRLGAAIPAGR